MEDIEPIITRSRERERSKNTTKQDTDDVNNKGKHIDNSSNVFLIVCIIGVTLGLLLEVINVSRHKSKKQCFTENKKYAVYSAHNDVENKNGLLKHVHLVLDRTGHEMVTVNESWDLLWSHDYPFRVLYPKLHRLKPSQRVNHIPGTGFITNKVDLATSESKYIPKAFKLPQHKKEFLEYARNNPKSMFLEKHNQHRGVILKNVTDIDVTSGESFVQEYMQKPFLVDGHKFDIGVYVVVTSVDPLRAFWFKGDVLFRYCPAKYYPFDPVNLDKYVVAEDYLPTWEVPSLAHPYTALGFSMKEAFDIYVREQGKEPSIIWDEVQNAIVDILLKKEHHLIEALKNYPSKDNFFEMMRFDLVINEDLKVYLLEANMSPNLSSAHFPPNQLLYEQVLYNLYSITGVSNPVRDIRENSPAQNMMSSQKNIAVFGNECSTICRQNCEENPVCGLCKTCLNGKLKASLLKVHREFTHRGDFRRLFPPPLKQNEMPQETDLKHLSQTNKLLYLWYQGKCNLDLTWCS